MLSGRAQETRQETTWDEVSGGFLCENSEIWIWRPLMSDSGVGFHQKMLDVEWEPFFFSSFLVDIDHIQQWEHSWGDDGMEWRSHWR